MNKKVKKTSKFIREYGMTLQEMSDRYGYSTLYIWSLHQRSDLHRFIEEQGKEKAEVR